MSIEEQYLEFLKKQAEDGDKTAKEMLLEIETREWLDKNCPEWE